MRPGGDARKHRASERVLPQPLPRRGLVGRPRARARRLGTRTRACRAGVCVCSDKWFRFRNGRYPHACDGPLARSPGRGRPSVEGAGVVVSAHTHTHNTRGRRCEWSARRRRPALFLVLSVPLPLRLSPCTIRPVHAGQGGSNIKERPCSRASDEVKVGAVRVRAGGGEESTFFSLPSATARRWLVGMPVCEQKLCCPQLCFRRRVCVCA